MDYLLQILFWCPRCWQNIGRAIFTVCGTLVLLGLRLMSRADRVERKTGVVIDLDAVLASIPLPIPASAEGMALALFGAMAGIALALTGKWARKFQ